MNPMLCVKTLVSVSWLFFSMTACMVDVPEVDSVEFKCVTDADCADGYFCAASQICVENGTTDPSDTSDATDATDASDASDATAATADAIALKVSDFSQPKV